MFIYVCCKQIVLYVFTHENENLECSFWLNIFWNVVLTGGWIRALGSPAFQSSIPGSPGQKTLLTDTLMKFACDNGPPLTLTHH